MNYTDKKQKELIEMAKKNDTYICGADGKLCGIKKENLPFPCSNCKRNLLNRR